ncbi:unnamed protein product, partial [Amoebophrya sp. A25]|eukprot:GSA25T00027170001.1
MYDAIYGCTARLCGTFHACSPYFLRGADTTLGRMGLGPFNPLKSAAWTAWKRWYRLKVVGGPLTGHFSGLGEYLNGGFLNLATSAVMYHAMLRRLEKGHRHSLTLGEQDFLSAIFITDPMTEAEISREGVVAGNHGGGFRNDKSYMDKHYESSKAGEAPSTSRYFDMVRFERFPLGFNMNCATQATGGWESRGGWGEEREHTTS